MYNLINLIVTQIFTWLHSDWSSLPSTPPDFPRQLRKIWTLRCGDCLVGRWMGQRNPAPPPPKGWLKAFFYDGINVTTVFNWWFGWIATIHPMFSWKKMIYLNLVGGLAHEFYDFPFSWEFHHPNWLSLHHFSGWKLKPPTRHISIVDVSDSGFMMILPWSAGMVEIQTLGVSIAMGVSQARWISWKMPIKKRWMRTGVALWHRKPPCCQRFPKWILLMVASQNGGKATIPRNPQKRSISPYLILHSQKYRNPKQDMLFQLFSWENQLATPCSDFLWLRRHFWTSHGGNADCPTGWGPQDS